MDVLGGLLQDLPVALLPANLFWCFVGCLLGTIVGILRGLRAPPPRSRCWLPLDLQDGSAGYGIIMMMAGI